jgi:lipopolysaccharide biosynthesis glycosyltransferase
MKVFVGYDTREDIAWQVCKHSIISKNKNADVQPLKLLTLQEQGWYTRQEDKLGSTEFTFSRFLIPELCNFNGWALFCDCDIIFLEDIKTLFDQADDKYAVMCVHHNYTPKEGHKMDGQTQTLYPRKNWSSMVLWNCGHPSNKQIDMELVNDPNTTGKYLHRFSWLKDEEIGQISHEWNWLVGWYKEPEDGTPKALHYTEGGPWFENYRNCEYHEMWKKELKNMMESK